MSVERKGALSKGDKAGPVVLHIDPFFDNPSGTFPIEEKAITEAGGIFRTLSSTDPEVLRREGAEAEIVLARSNYIRAAELDCLPCCRVIIRYGIGLDRIDVAEAKRRGIEVRNTPDFCVNELADHTLALLLAVVRGTVVAKDCLREGGWSMPEGWCPPRIADLCVGLIGFGRIAREVAARLQAFGCEVRAYDPFASQALFAEYKVKPVQALDYLLSECSVISLHCPATPETAGLLSAEKLSLLPPRAIVINTARGELVDTAALTAALQSGALAGVGLDVTDPEPLPDDHPLRLHPAAVVTPHVGWNSLAASRELSLSVARQVVGLISRMSDE